MFKLNDLFGGGGGSQDQGEATTEHTGGEAKAKAVNDWLGRITGAYNAVSGQGTIGGPAIDTRSGNGVNSAVQGTPSKMVIGIVVLVLAVGAFFLFRRK